MAIDAAQTRNLLKEIDAVFRTELLAYFPFASFVEKLVLKPAMDELRRLFNESRRPAFYLMGRSGHGKSSLINALAGQEVAKVKGGPEPCTPGTEEYIIRFPDRHAEWVAYDSRGTFDRHDASTSSPTPDAVSLAKRDIVARNPDIIFHVLNIKHVRAMADDVEVMRDVQAAVVKAHGSPTPMIAVLTHPDSVAEDLSEWPPEQYPSTQATIAEYVRAMAQYGATAGEGYRPIGSVPFYYGCQIHQQNSPYLYVVPANVPQKESRRWNVATLVEVISGELPAAARLQFFQALRRQEQLRQMAAALTRRFAMIAFGIGATPIPVGDMFLLAPLQMLLVAVIAGLSCRRPTLAAAKEYAASCGVVWATGMAARELFRQGVKFLPGGSVLSGGIAAAGTYSLGKSAEAYFFSGQVRPPAEFNEEGEGFALTLEPPPS